MDSHAISRFVAERRQIAAMHLLQQPTGLQPLPLLQAMPLHQPLVSQGITLIQSATSQQLGILSLAPHRGAAPLVALPPPGRDRDRLMRDLRQRDRELGILDMDERDWLRNGRERSSAERDDEGRGSNYGDEHGDVDDRYRYGDYDGDQHQGEEGSYANRRERRSRENRDRDRRERDRDRSRDRDRDRDRGRERDYRGSNVDDKGPDSKWMTDTPTNTILLRGLPTTVDEKDIRAELMMFGIPIKDVRLMKRKDTGASRGFAFVEFQTVTDAQRWMDHNQGEVTLLNEYTVRMYYSTPKTRESQDNRQQADWTCSKCGFTNFKRRDHCHKCNISRTESERIKEGDGFDQVGTNPCNTLIFRGLDALTTEDNILAALSKVSALTVKNVKVLRDDLTGTSRGYGFVEMNSLQESTQLLETLHRLNNPLEVDGKAVIVSYAKNTFSTVLATMNTLQQYDYSQLQSGSSGATASTDPNSSYYEQGGYYDANGQWVAYDYSYYQNYEGSSATQTDSTNAAAAVAQAALQAAQAAKAQQKQEDAQKKILAQIQHQHLLDHLSPEQRLAHQAQAWSSQQHTTATTATTTTTAYTASQDSLSGEEYVKYPVPDVSTYQYDETSGYYYDPSTGLYYDANSQYYYNAQTASFLYWDGEKQTYLPAPDGASEASGGLGQHGKSEDEKSKKDKDKKEKVKVAKKIAKDMEKWAKTMNAQKEAMKEGFKRTSQIFSGRSTDKESAAADAGFAILEKTKTERLMEPKLGKEDKKLMPPPPMPGSSAKSKSESPGLVASYGGDSEEDEEGDDGVVDEEKLLDWNKLACLLCKRQFPTKEALQRHTQLSDLHKTNLEELHKKKASTQQYRDRARERREKYGAPEPPLPRGRGRPAASEPVPFEQPTQAGIPKDNVGSKMMAKMGWSKGKGLGRSGQGIVDPVEATRRQAQAGLGVRGSKAVPNLEPGDSYKECVKKTMFARYHDID